jgi:hypothetical protein
MKLGKQTCPIKAIIRRGWLQTEMRVRINETKVAQYALEIREGARFPTPVVFVDPSDELFRVGDGFHRILACKENKAKEVEIDLRRGTFTDAFLWNISANKEQKGLPFSLGDKEKCITTLLNDPVTAAWSGSKIADTVGASNGYVSQVISAFKEAGGQRPQRTVDKQGIHRRAYLDRSPEEVAKRRETACKLYEQGNAQIAIARKMNVTRFAIQRYIKQATKEKELIECPYCHGSGKMLAEKAKPA